MTFDVRRVVTATDAAGRSFACIDDIIASRPGALDRNVSVANIWLSDRAPSIDGADPATGDFPVLPANCGAVFRLLELAPGAEPFMHRTATVDYVVVTEGELTMLLDDGVALTMRPRDVLIQRATVHGWANRGDGPCRFATVVLDASDANKEERHGA